MLPATSYFSSSKSAYRQYHNHHDTLLTEYDLDHQHLCYQIAQDMESQNQEQQQGHKNQYEHCGLLLRHKKARTYRTRQHAAAQEQAHRRQNRSVFHLAIPN